MKKTLVACLPLLFALTAHAEDAHWAYDGEGAPEHWGELSPEFALCSKGQNQTPVDIKGALKAGLTPLHLHFAAGAQQIVNNGHTVQINVAPGSTLTLDGDSFALQQFHFHTPSENHINGHAFPLEAHFVFKDKDGELAVLAMMFKEGKENQQLAQAWKNMPKEKGDPSALAAPVDIHALLPKKLAYYRFSGSLTTPPCSEGVRWLVLHDSGTASKAQIEHFAEAVHHHNNRPLQPLHGRVITD
jgi:carbonic anhydrase